MLLQNDPGVLRSDEDYVTGLKSPSDSESHEAVVELRAFLRGALARSFGRQLSDSDLDDITQESLLRVCARLDGFQGQARFTTWATTIAVHCALSELRRRRFKLVSLEDAAQQARAELTQEAELISGDQEAELAKLQRGIHEALTERQREATLAKLGGLPLMEIARRLGTTQGAVYKLLHDARKRLKSYLESTERPNEELVRTPVGAA
ncbi:MAG TPA: sigma-70 family RNA polymerase sigma factor [Polyangiaceae bacterium]|nr:sigma-70 family RNA polymerase sigma factor [Polyangiaceae bacterium]